jgi:chemosensory pili system protein ChpA (sensor histidine kinase/response regulator)
MSASQDYVALDWIKDEIGQTLNQAQQALEMVAESPDDAGSLRACLTAIHQVNGTLQMVQLDGPTQVAQEMESVTQSLMNSSAPDVAQAQEILMQSILQMPAYLDRIHREQKDAEANYMPIVNNLRVARGESKIGGDFEQPTGPNLLPFVTPADDETVVVFEKGNGPANAPKLRKKYQQSLVAVIKKSNARENLTVIGKVFSMLSKLCGRSPIGHLSQLGFATIEGIVSGAIKLDATAANMLKNTDKVLKTLSESGAKGLGDPVSEELVLGFIALLDSASTETPKITEAKSLYQPEAGAVDVAMEAVAIGPDDETLAAVAKILKEELTSVTDKLDLFVRSATRSTDDLVELLPMLEQISSTLVVVGLTQHQETVSNQVAFIQSVQKGEASPDEEHLLDMARALIEIEASLGILAGDSGEGGEIGDLNDAQAAVVRETRNGLAHCKDAVIEFVSSEFDHSKLEGLADELKALRGGLMIANQERSGDVLVSASYYVTRVLADKLKPELSEMDDLADAVTSIDYYLERLLESANDPYIQMIEVAEQAVEKLGFPVGIAPEVVAPSPASEEVETDIEETFEVVEESAVEETEDDDLIDEEILEIFVEEAEEVLESINEFLPLWRDNYSDTDSLAELRRAYHTLKGSGRMVGANVLGELAWSIENMLNRVIDNAISPSDDMLNLMRTVVDRIPEGVEAFRAQHEGTFEVQEMIDVAEALTNGEEVGAGVPVAEEVVEEVVEESAEEVIDEAIDEVVEETADDVEEQAAHESVDEVFIEEAVVVEVIEEDEPEIAEVSEEELTLDEAPTEPEDLELEELVLEDEPEIVEAPEEEPNLDEAPAEPEDLELEELVLEDEHEITESAEAEQEVETEVGDLQDLELEESVLDEDLEVAEVVEEELEALSEVPPEEGEPEDIDHTESEVMPESSVEELLEADDLTLEEIFVIEANEKIDLVKSFVTAPGVVDGDIAAAFHTLKGSAAMAEIPTISQIAAPLEQLALDYLGKQADDWCITKMRRGTGLIEQVISNLELHRNTLPGVEEFTQQFQEVKSEPVASFKFDAIELLGSVSLDAESWPIDNVTGLVAELAHVKEQAEEFGQADLLALADGLLNAHAVVGATPSADTIEALQLSHDELLVMLDQIAAGQTVGEAATLAGLISLVAPPPLRQEQAPADGLVELPADDVDEDILPIFLEETEELLEGIDESILQWSESPDNTDPLDILLRHLHTLKGGARMAGINSLGEFTHNFETFLIGLQQNPAAFDEQFFAQVNQQQDEITRRVEVYLRMANGEASDDELDAMQFSQPVGQEAVAPVQDTTPAVAPASVPVTSQVASVDLPDDEVDEDILPIFLEEAEELLEGIDESIQSWSEDPTGSTEPLDVLLRHLHTLKGGSRMAGLNSLGEYTHNFETYLIGIQSNPVDLDESFFALVNQQQDEMTRRVEIYNKLAAGQATAEELKSLLTSPATSSPLATGTEDEPVAEEVVIAPATDEDQNKAEIESERDKAAAPAAAQEMVRVSSDLLEELIGLAGESSINRGRVEQQITDFGSAIQEMEDTINRIRDQVRRLEIEAESRETLITQHGDDSSFDELEMDRYTMLQEISRSLSEGSSDMMDLKDTLVNRSRDAETLLHQQARIAGELQEGLTRTRMVPFAKLIPRLRRIVRQTSGEIGKSVRFDAFNVEGELDRSVLDRIVAPLEHMLRNAVDHGVESTEKRKEVGKPEQGRISLRLSREGGYIILTISDDGGGIAVDVVRSKAVERGLITEDSDISDHEVMQFIMHAGFSTAQKLTQISGRGVGMDVVGSEIKALGGSITIDSSLGVGTEFTIRIPFTVSINRALMVVVKEETYAIPLNTLHGIQRVSPYELEAYYQPDAPQIEIFGQPYRLEYLGRMLDKSENPNFEGQVAPLPVILASSGDDSVALQVDRVIGSREVVVKTLGPQFSEVGGISGATILGDGSVVVILDVMALVRSYEAFPQTESTVQIEEVLPEPQSHVRTVMIVDDSVTVRKVTSRLMERQGWDVVLAKDGLDAVTQLQDIYPDIVLLDIEMPKMDGFEVLRRVRADERLKSLPIIMITSRTGEKHQQQALELGVNQFLGKPFQEASLLATIEEVIGGG